MSYMPKVSIIIPTYRREQELVKALTSIAEQKYNSYEIILVDDNGNEEWNEKVKSVVDKFLETNPSIDLKHIVNSSKMGSAKTRNIGIEAASGEYVCFLDDDDVYLPKRIENQLKPMIENDADYSITDLALYSENEKLIEIRRRNYIEDTSKDSLLKYHLMHHMTGTDTLMFKRAYLLKIGSFDPIDVGDEFYLMCKAIENGGKFLYVPTCDVKAYVHTGEGGLSSGEGKIIGENQLYEYKKARFDGLDKKTVKYIKVRHYVVIAYTCLRNKVFLKCFINLIKALFISPVHFVRIYKEHRN